MDKIATENLFLLEFLVDNVGLDQKCECDAPPGETCVSFQFLDNVPLDVCEADFAPKRHLRDDKEQIKSGKSCLFSLSPDQARTSTKEFDIFVSVFRKMLPGWLPERVEIGMAVISVANLFQDLINSVQTGEGCTPTAKTLKDVFDLTNSAGTMTGKISVYIRMSCFGKLIVTQFQMNLDDKSVLFKDKEGKSLYRYKKAGKDRGGMGGCKPIGQGSMGGYNSSRPNTPGSRNGGYNASCPTNPCGGNGMQQQMGGGMGGYNSSCPTNPCGGNGMQQQMGGGGYNASCPTNPCGGGNRNGNNGMGQNQGGKNNDYECPFAPCMMDGMKNAQNQIQEGGGGAPCKECGAKPNASCATGGSMGFGGMGMGGFPQGGGPSGMMAPCAECGSIGLGAPCLPPPGMGMAMSPYAGGGMGNTPCIECQSNFNAACAVQQGGQGPPQGNYQEIGASMGGNSLTIRVHKDQGNVEQVDDDCTCGGGSAGSPGKQMQNFSMRPGVPQKGNPHQPFAFRMGQVGNAGDNNNVVVNPPTCVSPDGTQFTEFSDPNKETFILRIGKKSEGADKKNNLELELCTPKGPPLKPLPKFETRDTQFDPLDLGGGKGGKGGKKGKGGKGKGGKGGKGGGKKGGKKKK